jgi:hypothetical protein
VRRRSGGTVAKWCSGGGERVSPVCVVLCVCACGGVCVVHVWLHVGQATAFAESPDLGLSVKSRTRGPTGCPTGDRIQKNMAFAESPNLGLSAKSGTRWAHVQPWRRPNFKKEPDLRREPNGTAPGEELTRARTQPCPSRDRI